MADIPSATATNTAPERGGIGDFLVSTLLVLSTLAVGIACAIFLASTLTQTRMSGITVHGVNINIWKLREIHSKWSDVQKQLHNLSQDLSNAEKQRRDWSAHRLAIEAEFESKRTELIIALAELNFRLPQDPPKEGTTPPAHSPDPAVQYGQIQAAREALLKEHKELEPLLQNIENAYENYRPARSKRAEIRAKIASMPEEIKSLQDAMSGTRTSVDAIYDQVSIKIDDGTRARVENV